MTGERWKAEVLRIHEGVVKPKGRPPWSIDDRNFLALALCGEAGELANLIKKDWRGDAGDRSAEIAEELADCRIYLELLAGACRVALLDDAAVTLCAHPPCVELLHYAALQLQGRCGAVASAIEAQWSEQCERNTVQQFLREVQRAIVTLADLLDIDIDAACEAQLPKIYRRWPEIAPKAAS